MHNKKKYINKSAYSIQGIKTISNSLPPGVNKIMRRGGYNYSSLVNNWTEMVGKKISEMCYPKSIKIDKNLTDGVLLLNVFHGNQLFVEYSKQDIIDKINSFFGYKFIKQVKIALVDEKVDMKNKDSLNSSENKKIDNRINEIKNSNLKKKLIKLVTEYENKSSK